MVERPINQKIFSDIKSTPPRTVIIGSKGQLGQALMAMMPAAIGLHRGHLDLSRSNLDQALSELLKDAGNIFGVINAAAYTDVDNAESEVDLANRINGSAPGQIAEFCNAENIPFVHISTDYVFSGEAKFPYVPDQTTCPINAYGKSKREGELAVEASNATSAVLRTSWVYDGFNPNFLTTMLRLSETRDCLSIVGDQFGRPTYTVDLAKAAVSALHGLMRNASKKGIYHVSNTGEAISWAQFAKAIFASTGKTVSVTAIRATEYPTPAARPAYSVLDTSKFEREFGHSLPGWKDGLARALSNL